jgi:hypothetical protein
MDLNTLFNIAKAVAKSAEKALDNAASDSSHTSYMKYSGYPAFINEYNGLIPWVVRLCGDEAKLLFQPIDLGKQNNPADTTGFFWKSYLELVSTRLNSLVAYLQSLLGSDEREIESIIDIIGMNTRPSLYEKPNCEKDVQNALDIIFRVRGFDYQKEKTFINYSSKQFKPDFTFDALDLALEVKLCNSGKKEKDIIDEINADILAYQTKYSRALFVVFDLGFIRDVNSFKASIEKNQNVHVIVIKW